MQTIKTIVQSILAGLCIAIGGMVYLSLDNKVLGALFFVVGIFIICTFGFDLFTGKVCYALENGKPYNLRLPLIWLGNFAGALLGGSLIHLTSISSIAAKAVQITQGKLEGGYGSVFILSILCNLLVYVAVEGFQNNPHELGKYLSLFFGVTVFILSGFEHCVANMFFISAAGMWSLQAVVFILINTLGNIVGGLLIPATRKYLPS